MTATVMEEAAAIDHTEDPGLGTSFAQLLTGVAALVLLSGAALLVLPIARARVPRWLSAPVLSIVAVMEGGLILLTAVMAVQQEVGPDLFVNAVMIALSGVAGTVPVLEVFRRKSAATA
ncbi:hypothetical protein [Streptomyces cadmiisoli]|uniref:hypothetical protein n=1 Tax=Streptomyces cadmiisoli TaxID=2184053 RepID=UPI0013A6B046|nr:hypothetical protein [Streptomyces cadmiisoli]